MAATRTLIDKPTVATPLAAAEIFDAVVMHDLAAVAALVTREAASGVAASFDGLARLANWREAFVASDDIDPFVVVARARETGTLAMVLLLARQRYEGLWLIAPLDTGAASGDALILGAAAPNDAINARALWRAVRRILPPADLIKMMRSPRELSGRANPLALLGHATPSIQSRDVIDIDALMITGTRRVMPAQRLRQIGVAASERDRRPRSDAVSIPLIDLVEAASWRGWRHVCATRVRAIAARLQNMISK